MIVSSSPIESAKCEGRNGARSLKVMWELGRRLRVLGEKLRSITSCSLRRNNGSGMVGWAWDDDIYFRYVYRTIQRPIEVIL